MMSAGADIASGPSRRPMPLLLIPVLLALATFAALAPARLKLLGLFPATIGAAAGYFVVRFLPDGWPRWRLLIIAALLVPVTLAGYGAGSFFVWRRARAQEVAANLLAQPGGRAILDRVRSEEPPANEAEAEFLVAYRDRMNPPPSAYLTDRLKGLPANVAKGWAIVIASAEFALGWAAGIVAAGVTAPRRRRE